MLRRMITFFSGEGPRRQEGRQSAMPLTYADKAAAPVTFDTAMEISAFWASARLISEAVAAMPIRCVVQSGKGRKEDRSNKLWRVLNYQPNRYQTRTEFFETVVLNLCVTGNSYCAVQRDGDEIVSLMPLMSSQMEVELLEDGTPVYTYYDGAGNVRVYSSASIWHVKLFGNGVVGLSPLGHARQSLGIAIASDSRASRVSANGGKSSGVLMVDRVLTPEQRAAVRANFANITSGNDDHLFVLEADMKYQQTSMSPADAQLLETRKFQIEDIARFMGVPSVLINDTSGSTTWGSGIEQLVQGFYKLNLRPYLERLESSMKRHLMPVSDWDSVDIEFDFDALLRADKLARYEAYAKAVNAAVLTPNEPRAAEGLEPKQGGDELIVNGNMIPLNTVQASRSTQTPPKE